jgi:hypothetical protein
MRRLSGMVTSLVVAGVFPISTSAYAQAQKGVETAKATTEPASGGPPSPRELGWQKLLTNADSRSRPFFLAEYHLIRNVCAPTPEHAKVLAREAEREYRAIVREIAGERMAEIDRQQKAGAAAKSIRVDDTLQLRPKFRAMLAKVAKDHLTAEQMKRFETDAAKRAAMLRETGIETLLVMIDQELILTDHQRDEIRRSLDSHWREAWFPDPAIFLVGKRLLPMIPEDCVAKSLTENQRKAWRLIPKAEGYSTRMHESFLIPHLQDGTLEDDDLRAAKEAEARIRDGAAPGEAAK